MTRPRVELNPAIADDVPWSDTITAYDEAHFVVYLRLLDAVADGLRGPRKEEAGRRLRLHARPGLPPTGGGVVQDRRDPPRPAAQGILPARPQAIRLRARRPGASSRGHRPARRAHGRWVLVLGAHRH